MEIVKCWKMYNWGKTTEKHQYVVGTILKEIYKKIWNELCPHSRVIFLQINASPVSRNNIQVPTHNNAEENQQEMNTFHKGIRKFNEQ